MRYESLSAEREREIVAQWHRDNPPPPGPPDPPRKVCLDCGAVMPWSMYTGRLGAHNGRDGARCPGRYRRPTAPLDREEREAPPADARVSRGNASAIAGIVAEHWRDAALHWGSERMEGRLAAHPLVLVIAALDGETRPEMLGVEPGPDAERIRAIASGPE